MAKYPQTVCPICNKQWYYDCSHDVQHLMASIEAGLKLADELHNRGYSSNADSLLAKDIAEQLTEALGGSDE